MIWSFIAAFLTGIFAAMGVGGGMILIIYLIFWAGFPQLAAQGINLLYFIPIAVLAVIIHTKNKLIEWKKIVPSLIFGTISAVLGAIAADHLGSEILGKIFGGFIIIIGIKELCSGFNANTKHKKSV